jgi:hypothetical protein
MALLIHYKLKECHSQFQHVLSGLETLRLFHPEFKTFNPQVF